MKKKRQIVAKVRLDRKKIERWKRKRLDMIQQMMIKSSKVK